MPYIKCRCGFNIGNYTKKGTIRCCKCGYENPISSDTTKKVKKEEK